jgi:hypothetical protein
LILFAALLGFTIAWMTAGSVSVRRSAQASAGLLNVAIPAGWRQQPVAAATRLHLSDELELRPSRAAGSLVIGRSSAPQALIAQTVQSWSAARLRPQTIAFGGARYVRYGSGSSPGAESVFVLPTTIGSIVGVCRPSSLTSRCEQVLASLQASPTAPRVSLNISYASSLSAIIENLSHVSSTANASLLKATDATEQAAAAGTLATADANAAASLLGLRAGAASAANSALAAALRMRSRAYGALARAATAEDATSYATARAAVTRAGAALSSAFARLRAYGYQVG